MSTDMLESLINSRRSKRRGVSSTELGEENTTQGPVFRYVGKRPATFANERNQLSCSGVGENGVLTLKYVLALLSARVSEPVLLGLIGSTCQPNKHHLALYLCSPESVSVLVCSISQPQLLKLYLY